MGDICNITKNKYVCATNVSENDDKPTKYSIKTNEDRIANELMTTNYINFDTTANEISLTANSSNHYFWADERAHCSEKWQDWFCVPNYHNNNNVNKYPNTKTMSVGVCYNTCPNGYTVSGINKCAISPETNGELIHNPLAIIAMFGTCLYINKSTDALSYYNDIADTIGIRGSYLNDLYRVNNNNKFITNKNIGIAKTQDAILPYSTAPTVVFTGDGTGADATAVVIGGVIKSIRMNSGGSGYTTEPTVTFTRNAGETGTNAEAIAELNRRVIRVDISIGSGGTGYTKAPTVVFAGGGGSGAYAIASVNNGVITAVKLISGGSGYTTDPTVTFTRIAGETGVDAVATVILDKEVLRVTISNGGTNYNSNTTTQEKLLLKIINKFVNTGRPTTETVINRTIKNIQDDIKKSAGIFIVNYIDKIKNNDEALNKFSNKIMNYKFDINKLDRLHGKDKNGNRKFVNIIAYAYNIMCLVLYKVETVNGVDTWSINTPEKISEKINVLILRGIQYTNTDVKLNEAIFKVFISACTNCFKVNFDLFNNYMKKYLYTEDIMCILKNGTTLKFDSSYFAISKITEDTSKKTYPYKYEISLYNNLYFYDHRLLSEYSENTKYIIQILILFAVGLAIIIIISGIYSILIFAGKRIFTEEKRFKLLEYFTNFFNYVFLFYKKIMYNLIQSICFLYYIFFCKYSKSNYTLVYVICNLANLVLIIFLVGSCFASLLELLNVDYIDLLTNIKLTGSSYEIPPEYNGVFNKVIKYSVYLYFVITYLYCAYLVRYGLNENQFDILSNPDADYQISIDYLYNILLSQYSANILSNIDAIYTEGELLDAVGDENLIKHIQDVEAAAAQEAAAQEAAEQEAAAQEAAAATSVDVAGGQFGNILGDNGAKGLEGALGDGKIDAKGLEGALANGNFDAKGLEGALGDGKINAKGLEGNRRRGNQDQQQQLEELRDANPEYADMAGKFGIKIN